MKTDGVTRHQFADSNVGDRMALEPEGVSVVLPTYNGSAYLRQSIDSCLAQTHTNLELIIVDDGSTDSTAEIVESYTDARITLIRCCTNRGLPNALNSGFSVASGDYLTWTSDDNFYVPTAIERMLEFMKRREIDFVYSNYYRVTDVSRRRQKRVLIETPDHPAFENGNSIGACFLYTREVMTGTGGYDPEAVLAEDYDYWIRVSKRFLMCHLDEALYYYRDHPEALSYRRHSVRIASLLVILKNRLVDFREASKLYSTEIAEPVWVSRNRLFANCRISRRFGSRLAALKRNAFSVASLPILKDFSDGSITFPEARVRLSELTETIRADHRL